MLHPTLPLSEVFNLTRKASSIHLRVTTTKALYLPPLNKNYSQQIYIPRNNIMQK